MNIGGSRWVALACVALALVVTACSSGTDETVVPLTDPPTTSTTASATSATTTTAAPTTTAPTPIVETTGTTTNAVADETALIELAVAGSRSAFVNHVLDRSDASAEQLAAFQTDAALEASLRTVQELSDSGLGTRQADNPTETTEILSVELVDTNQAIAIACFASNGVVFDISSDEVVSGQLASFLVSAALERRDGRWLVVAEETLQRFDGAATCG